MNTQHDNHLIKLHHIEATSLIYEIYTKANKKKRLTAYELISFLPMVVLSSNVFYKMFHVSTPPYKNHDIKSSVIIPQMKYCIFMFSPVQLLH